MGGGGWGDEGLVVNLRLPMVIIHKLAPGDGGDGGRLGWGWEEGQSSKSKMSMVTVCYVEWNDFFYKNTLTQSSHFSESSPQ